jgi:hypothetical protein
MSIQEDLQICKSGDGIEIVGLVDLGEEGNICKTLSQGRLSRQFQSHRLIYISEGLPVLTFHQ